MQILKYILWSVVCLKVVGCATIPLEPPSPETVAVPLHHTTLSLPPPFISQTDDYNNTVANTVVAQDYTFEATTPTISYEKSSGNNNLSMNTTSSVDDFGYYYQPTKPIEPLQEKFDSIQINLDELKADGDSIQAKVNEFMLAYQQKLVGNAKQTIEKVTADNDDIQTKVNKFMLAYQQKLVGNAKQTIEKLTADNDDIQAKVNKFMLAYQQKLVGDAKQTIEKLTADNDDIQTKVNKFLPAYQQKLVGDAKQTIEKVTADNDEIQAKVNEFTRVQYQKIILGIEQTLDKSTNQNHSLQEKLDRFAKLKYVKKIKELNQHINSLEKQFVPTIKGHKERL